MKTTMRDAVVNCRPTKMQKNSAANSAPASRPPRSVRVARRRAAMPRDPGPEPDQDRRAGSSAAPPARARGSRAAPPSPRPGSGPRESSRGRGRRRRAASRWVLRSRHRRPMLEAAARSPPSSRGGPSAPRASSVADAARCDAAPATRPLAWANGAVAMSQPGGWRSGAPQGASLATLSASPPSRSAPIARRGPRACSDQVHGRRTRRRREGRPRGRRSGAGRVGRAGRAASAARRAARRRRPATARARTTPSAPTSAIAGEVGEQVQRAVVDERRA